MAARAPDATAFLKLLANQNRLMILCALTEQEIAGGVARLAEVVRSLS